MKNNFSNLVEQYDLFKTDHFTSNDIDKIIWEIYPELYGTQKIVSFMQQIPLKYYYFIPKNTFTWNDLMYCIYYFGDDYESLCPELVKVSFYHKYQVFTLNSAENIISDALGIDFYKDECGEMICQPIYWHLTNYISIIPHAFCDLPDNEISDIKSEFVIIDLNQPDRLLITWQGLIRIMYEIQSNGK